MSLRRRALNALTAVTEDGAYANLALKEASNGLSPEDARFLYALVYGVLDRLIPIDYELQAVTNPHKNRYVRNILRMGAAELRFMHTPAHAAVSESVALCKEIGKSSLSGYVNGVLRAIERDKNGVPLPKEPVKRLSVRYSFPEWIVSAWIDAYGEAFTEELLAAPPVGLTVRAQYPESTEQLIKELPCAYQRGKLDENALLPARGFDLLSFPAFTEGRMAVQGEGAMLICRALGDVRGKKVLDACAAPGGKSAYLASLTENNVDLTCFELHEHRAALMEKTFERLHVAAEIKVCDAAEHDAAYDEFFDAVLVDAPCSGLGMLMEKPDLRYAKTDEDVIALSVVQARILDTAAAYVRPGGTLVYATCTISKRENEAQIERFLSGHAKFSLEKVPVAVANDGMLNLFPNVHGTDGYFICRMKKCS